MGRSVEERRLGNGLPDLILGEGPPLAVFPGLGMTNGNPTGVQRWGELRLLAPLARHFIVHRISWRVGLARGTTMADLAADYARAIEEGFRGPVDVLGISTGGSIALQLAADRPDLVNKLVVAGAARRLSEHGRKVQRRAAALSAAGDRRGLSRMQAADVADSRLGRSIAGALLGLAGPVFISRGWNPSDMIATIEAEDAFDLRGRLDGISAPTLVIGGGRDRFYPTRLFRETAEGIPDGRLVIYEDRAHGGTFADKRFGRDVFAFLSGSSAERRAPLDRSGDAGVRELLDTEWRVISSRKRSPLPLRLAKWAAFIAATRRLYGTKWFGAWVFGLPLAGVATHLLYRHKTRGWTQPWGGWDDPEIMGSGGEPVREDR